MKHAMRWAAVAWGCGGALALAAAEPSETDYAAVVRSHPTLLAYYRCEAAADDLEDASGHGRAARWGGPAGEPVGGVSAALGHGVRLAGGGHLRVPALGEQTAATFEIWLRLRRTPSEGIAALYASNGWSRGFWHINLRVPGDVELAVDGVSLFPHSEPETVPTDRWIHLVATYDSAAGELKLYRDGRLLMDEIVANAVGRELADHGTEDEQDRQGQPGGHRGQPPSNRPAVGTQPLRPPGEQLVRASQT